MRRAHPAGPAAALALGAVVLLSAAGAASAATAAPVPGPAPSTTTSPAGPADAGEAGLEVLSVMPAELRPGGRVVVRGRVTGGEDGLAAARVEVRRAATRTSSVSALERWTAAVDARPGPAAGEEDFDDPAADARTELVVEVGDVAAGAAVPFTATLDAGEVGLRETAGAAGAYGLQLLLLTGETAEDTDGDTTGDTDGDTDGETNGDTDADGDGDGEGAADPVDDERGFLLWSPAVELVPTRLSTTVVLQGPPPTAATGLPDPAELVRQAAPGGRLDRLLGAAGALDADWVVDPVLLAGMAVVADPAAAAALTPPAGPSAPAPDQPPASTPPATAGPTAGTTAAPTPGAPPSGSTGTPGGPVTGAAAPTGPDTTGTDTTSPDTTGRDTTGTTGPDVIAPDTTAPGGTAPDPAAVATGWLEALAGARDDREVVLADWADPDPARLRSADDEADAWATLRTAQQAALPPALVEALLDGSTRTDVLAATGTALSAPDLATLVQGRSSVLLPEELLPLQEPFALTFTPDAVTEVTAGGRRLTAVLDDPGLSADTASAVEGSPLALTRVLARLATTTLQRPNDPRLLAAALPPDLDPVPGAAEHLAGALASTPWAETVPLSTALGTPPSDAAREPLPTGREPDVPGVQALLDAVDDGREVAAAVASPQDPLAGASLDLRAAATLSRSADPGAAAELAARLREQTSGTVGGVQVVPGSRVTLVAAQAALPVTVVNDLPTEVSLVLEVRSRSPRLQVPEPRVPVTVAPGQRAVVDVPVVAVASGPAEVTSQLMTAGGRPWGPASPITVTVATQAEGRVLTGVGAGVAVLFVAGAARAFVRDRRGRELVGAGPVEP